MGPRKTEVTDISGLEYAMKLTRQRIGVLEKEGIIVRIARGKYDLVETIRRYVDFLQASRAGKQIKKEAYEEARTRREIATAEQEEIKLAMIKKEIIDFETVKEKYGRKLFALKTSLEIIPKSLSRKANPLDPTLSRQVMEEGIASCLRSVSGDLKKIEQANAPKKKIAKKKVKKKS